MGYPVQISGRWEGENVNPEDLMLPLVVSWVLGTMSVMSDAS